jgi:hypothetical protein
MTKETYKGQEVYNRDLAEERLYDFKFERMSSFDHLLPVDWQNNAAPELKDYTPSLASAFLLRSGEFYGGTGTKHAPDRLPVLKRIESVLEPLTNYHVLHFPYKSEKFISLVLEDVTKSKSPDAELENLHKRKSEILLAKALKTCPKLRDDMAHVYALAWAFCELPGINKFLLRSNARERENNAQLKLLNSYIKEDGLTREALAEAEKYGVEVEVDPKDPFSSMRYSIGWIMRDMYSRSMLLGRFEDAREAAELNLKAIKIMQKNEPESHILKSRELHYGFIAGNMPQLKKEVLYISGASESFK